MNPFFLDLAAIPPALFFIRLATDITGTLLVALAASTIAHRASAAVRHKIWALAALVTLLLPALLLVAPEYRLSLVTSASSQAVAAPVTFPSNAPATPVAPLKPVSIGDFEAGPSITQPTGTSHPFPIASVLLIAYIIPTTMLIFRFVFGAFASRQAVRRAVRLKLSNVNPDIPVLESSQVKTPVCVGYFQPAILLSSSWRTWPADQLHAVLTHELAHVARRDILWQGIAKLACALYWPHPLIWYAARKMRIEREFACDDSVLRSGASPTNYSRWLLDLACQFKTARLGIAMAGRAGLPARVEAALSTTRPRNPVSRRFSLVSLIFAVIVLLLASTLSPLTTVRASQEKPNPSAPSSPALHPSVLLVTEGNVLLQEALTSLNLKNPRTMLPAEYEQKKLQNFSVVVFDRYTPKWIPETGNFVYVGVVPPTPGPAPEIALAQDLKGNPITLTEQKVLKCDHNHPLLKNVSLDRLWVQKALKLKLPPDATSLVDGTKGSLIALAKGGKRTNLVIAFDLSESTWPLDLSFPMFWHRLIQFLAPASDDARPATQPSRQESR